MKRVTILTVSERAAWERAIAQDGLPSHSWYYARGLVVAGLDPRLVVIETPEARMLLPYIERPIEGTDRMDIATIPGLSGAGISADSLAPMELWEDYARAQGWVSGYIQLGIRHHALQALDPARVVPHNVLIQFDLESWGIDSSIRHQARKSIKMGDKLGAVLVTDKDRLREPFLEIHYAAMERLRARSVFPRACIECWLEDPEVVLLGAEVEGRVEAVHLSRQHGAHAELHLAATTEFGRPLGAWLIWKATDFFRASGARYLNIGGAGRPGDGIHWAKSRFNADEFPLLSMRQIYDRAAFDALCAAVGDRLNADRFPPYRV